MMTAHTKYPGTYAPVGQDVQSDLDRRKLVTQRKFLLVSLLMILMPVVLVRVYFSYNSIFYSEEYPESSPEGHKQPLEAPDVTKLIDFSVGGCNIWKGDWIPYSSEPAYSNETCRFIQDHQNCLKNGIPDRGYLYWRWKPTDCDLPLFDAKTYLKLVRGKSWAFIGDSIARNHFQSFLCSLAQVEIPDNLYRDKMDRFVYWYFPSYKFTLSVLWSPFLVAGTEDEVDGYAKGIEKLYLDTVDNWKTSLHKYDYVVLSSGQWFLKTSVYYVNGKVVGCHNCQPGIDLKQVGFYYAFRMALRTAFDFLVSSGYNGTVFFRTFTPDHFENGRWDNGGNCPRKVPFRSNLTGLQGMTAEMYRIQLEEFGKTLLNSSDFSFKLRLADTIHASLLRPDAHPGPYRHVHPFVHDKNAKVQNDCLHWCLPGAIDTWSAMLLEMLQHS